MCVKTLTDVHFETERGDYKPKYLPVPRTT